MTLGYVRKANEMQDVYAVIRQAILNKDQVIGIYQGHNREICPHVLGSKEGRSQALFYQFGGTSNSGLGPVGSGDNWRCFPIAGLSNVSTRKGDWYTAPNYSQQQTCVDFIDVAITFF